MAYQYNSRKAQPIRTTFSPEDAIRFWNLVNKSNNQGPNGDCWEWTAHVYPHPTRMNGYGKFFIRGENLRAPRVAYLLGHGTNPGEQMVLHSCDNPLCCRPEHLSLGDAKKNREECVKRGRIGKGMKSHSALRSPLTPERIKAIRKAWATGAISQCQLALIAGLKPKTVNDIIRRVSWDYPECG